MMKNLKPRAALTVTLLYVLLRREFQRLERRDAQIQEAQAALRESEQQLSMQSTALQSAANAVMIADREGRITWTNSAFTRLTGYTAAEALGQTPRLLKSGRHDESFYRRLWETILSGQVWRGEITNRRKDGSLFTEELTITPVRDERGAISHFIGIQQDITERKRAEETLRARARQQAVVAKLGQRALGGTDLSTLLEEAVTQLAQTLDVEYCKVLELVPDGDALLLRAGVGWKDGCVGHATVGAGTDSQAGCTLLANEPVIVEDLRTETRFSGPPLLHDHGVVSGLSVIIPARDGPFGVLGAHTTRRRTFTRDDIHFLQAVANVLATAIDRKRVEEALREANETLTALIHASPLAIMAVDPAGNIKTWNPAAERIFGWAEHEVIGRPNPMVPGDKQEEFLAFRQRVLQGESFTGVETRRQRRDGSPVEVSISTAPLRDGKGDISGIMGVIADITERKGMVEALIRRTRQLDALRSVSAEITRELDLPTLLGLIVRRAAELVGAASGTVFLWDERDQVLVPEAWHGFGEWRREMRCRLGEAAAGTAAQRRRGLIVNDYRTSPYAHPVTLERTGITAVLAEPLLYHDRLVGVLTINDEGTGRAFTEEDRATLALFATQAAIAIENARLYQEIQQHAAELEERVRQRTRELEEASRHKSEFLANMSHELRTPLNSIIGFAEFLQEQRAGPLSEKQARYLGHIRASGKHLVEVIGDILDLAKAEAGRIVLQPESLSVATTLEDILVTTRGLAHQKNQTVEADIQPDMPPLWADPIRFKQILFNLLSNAAKFTPNGGRIILTARRVSASQSMGAEEQGSRGAEEPSPPPPSPSAPLLFLEIRVSDTGIGIRAEDLPRLFQQFVQLEATATKHHEGTGLGLALTKRLVELHEGRIWAESAGEGQGSTFTIVLPFGGPGGDRQT